MARKSGVNHDTIVKLEEGIGNPTLKTIVQIADALDVDIGFLSKKLAYDLGLVKR